MELETLAAGADHPRAVDARTVHRVEWTPAARASYTTETVDAAAGDPAVSRPALAVSAPIQVAPASSRAHAVRRVRWPSRLWSRRQRRAVLDATVDEQRRPASHARGPWFGARFGRPASSRYRVARRAACRGTLVHRGLPARPSAPCSARPQEVRGRVTGQRPRVVGAQMDQLAGVVEGHAAAPRGIPRRARRDRPQACSASLTASSRSSERDSLLNARDMSAASRVTSPLPGPPPPACWGVFGAAVRAPPSRRFDRQYTRGSEFRSARASDTTTAGRPWSRRSGAGHSAGSVRRAARQAQAVPGRGGPRIIAENLAGRQQPTGR